MPSNYRSPYSETYFGDSDEEPEYVSELTAKDYAQGVKEIPDVKISKFISDSELNQGLNKWLPRPDDPCAARTVLRDSVFQPISELLVMYGKGEWSLRPRIFSVLKILGCPDLLDCFAQEGLMDSALPFTDSTLPVFLKGSEIRSKFLKLQQAVLHKEKGLQAMEEGGTHLHLAGSGDDYFRSIKPLGMGRYGHVDQVFSANTGRVYARKRIVRGHSPLADERLLKQFESEIQALKKLWHPHIVKLKGSYTDQRYLGIIVTPVAEMNLEEYLKEASHDETLRRRRLRSFAGCLATALAYLHQQNIRHNDIKPQNILVANLNVFLSDFGTSRAWGTEGRSTTQGKHEGYTPRYSAPETHETGRRSTGDMWTFFEDNGTMRIDAIWANQASAKLWVAMLAEDKVDADPNFLDLILDMLQSEPGERPTAAQVRGRLIDECNSNGYICPYCASPDGLSPTQNPLTLAEARKKSATQNEDLKLPDLESTDSVSASLLNLPERREEVKLLSTEDIPSAQKSPSDGTKSQANTTQSVVAKSPARQTKVRFAGLPEELRPMPADPAQPSPEDATSFVYPKPVMPPPFRQKDSLPLPEATLVPSYVLAGTNHFTKTELSVANRPLHVETNLFVYGRLMFPSILNAIAVASTKGFYSPELKRRLHPSSADWAKADLSIKHASEAMTPAILRGYDRWRPRGLNCAVIQDRRLTKRILRRREERGYKELPCVPVGEVVGFLILGVKSDALRVCDAIFGGDEKALRSMKTPQQHDDGDSDWSDDEDASLQSSRGHGNNGHGDQRLELLARETVEVEVEAHGGSIEKVHAQTYVWTDGIRDLDNIWEEERFLRSKHMQNTLGEASTTSLASWIAQEQTLASIMNISFARVGDYLCGPILAGNIQELAILLRNGFDANAACRIYGRPLNAAVVKGREDMVRLLMDNGAQVSGVSEGGQYGTPLIAAAYSGRKSISKLLLQCGADIYEGDGVHVNAVYQAVAHGDYALAEMFLDQGAWLCMEWREIRDLAEELQDGDILALLESYDVRKMHMKYLRESEHLEETRVSSDEVYDDSVNVRLLPGQLRHKAINWDDVNLSKVGVAVIRRIATASRMSGSWKGRRGVAVVLAALNAGAPKEILKLLRGVVNPLRRLAQILREAEENSEDGITGKTSIPLSTGVRAISA
ncbi:hypothetical protein J7T55_007922 [Diaporthe amygdali]|uniref:uncharacterized protein n=1 Tax=Phomopsis amygdali TaxID=1214568 RepID=UPI0022FEBAA3|nr:uncharacterized protein J7T55_007922 [Diaporthe amygdali]KAJ0114088.1 hypothetical protein J7T55_007922 [Diaporthe amygdali]